MLPTGCAFVPLLPSMHHPCDTMKNSPVNLFAQTRIRVSGHGNLRLSKAIFLIHGSSVQSSMQSILCAELWPIARAAVDSLMIQDGRF